MGILDLSGPQHENLVFDTSKINASTKISSKTLVPIRDTYNEHDEVLASSLGHVEATLETLNDPDTDPKP